MKGHCSTGQSPQWAIVLMEEEEEEEYRRKRLWRCLKYGSVSSLALLKETRKNLLG